MSKRSEYSTDLLRRWLSGETTRREEAELERLAGEDPFLAGAMEGYRAWPAGNHAERLTRLRRLLQPSRRRVLGPLLVRIAAAVALLFVAGGIWWWLQPELSKNVADLQPVGMEREEAAREREQPLADSTLPAREPAPAPVERTTAVTGAAESLASDQRSHERESPELATKQPAQTPPIPPPAEEVASDDDFAALAEEDFAAEPLPDLPTSITPPEPAGGNEVARAPARQATALEPSALAMDQAPRYRMSNSGVPVALPGTRLVRGTVTDSEGYPLIGANILSLDRSDGTVTDLQGYFQFAVDSSQQSLLVSYTGYQETMAIIPPDGELAVTLGEDSATLDEVVVTGYAQERAEDADYLPQVARPVEGFEALKNYIARQTPPSAPRGKVRLRFKVYPDGRLDDFEVIRSTNPALEALAIRLLQNGPIWEITGGDKEAVEKTYTVRFP